MKEISLLSVFDLKERRHWPLKKPLSNKTIQRKIKTKTKNDILEKLNSTFVIGIVTGQFRRESGREGLWRTGRQSGMELWKVWHRAENNLAESECEAGVYMERGAISRMVNRWVMQSGCRCVAPPQREEQVTAGRRWLLQKSGGG